MLVKLVPDRRLLAQSEHGVAIVLSHVDAYTTGCAFRIRISAQRRPQISDEQCAPASAA